MLCVMWWIRLDLLLSVECWDECYLSTWDQHSSDQYQLSGWSPVQWSVSDREIISFILSQHWQQWLWSGEATSDSEKSSQHLKWAATMSGSHNVQRKHSFVSILYIIFCYNSCSVSEQTTSLESSSSRLSLSVSLSLVLIVSIVFSNCIRDKSKQWSHFISFTPLKHYIKHKTELFHRKEAHSKIFVWEIKSTKLTSKVTTEWDAEERDSI